VGFKTISINLPETVSEADLLSEIQKLNQNGSVHGILVQLPLPQHINEELVLTSIDFHKDVDGLHPMNVAKLAIHAAKKSQ